MTSWPMAFSMTCSVKSLTTLKLTSASSSAVRTSRIASRMFSSLIRPAAGEAAEDAGELVGQGVEHVSPIISGRAACEKSS